MNTCGGPITSNVRASKRCYAVYSVHLVSKKQALWAVVVVVIEMKAAAASGAYYVTSMIFTGTLPSDFLRSLRPTIRNATNPDFISLVCV
jgi:hypothetical protein